MQRRPFDAEMELFRDSARKFFQQEIRPHGERWREANIVDREAFLKAGAQGYLCMWADEQYGGMGIKDFRYEQILIEENAFHGDTGYFISLHSRLVAPYIGNFGTDEQKQRFLPGAISGETILAVAMTEPDAGSDLAGMKSRAVEHDDHWLLNGSKTYISNGINADVVIVAAKTHPENPHGITLFILERGMPGFERGRNLKKMGLKSQDTAELFFHDVKIPKANVLGQVHRGFYHLMHGLAEERLMASCGNIVSARVALEVTKKFVQDRKVFGKPLSKFQNTRFTLADIKAKLDIDIEDPDVRCLPVDLLPVGDARPLAGFFARGGDLDFELSSYFAGFHLILRGRESPCCPSSSIASRSLTRPFRACPAISCR